MYTFAVTRKNDRFIYSFYKIKGKLQKAYFSLYFIITQPNNQQQIQVSNRKESYLEAGEFKSVFRYFTGGNGLYNLRIRGYIKFLFFFKNKKRIPHGILSPNATNELLILILISHYFLQSQVE